jgi:tungstate transport system substrate-binding protein
MQRREFLAATGAAVTAAVAGCLGDDSPTDAAVVGEELTLATTTSTYDTGLLNELNAEFGDLYGVSVDAVAQGTGASLATARNGDSDVVMVHARSLEDAIEQRLIDGEGG